MWFYSDVSIGFSIVVSENRDLFQTSRSFSERCIWPKRTAFVSCRWQRAELMECATAMCISRYARSRCACCASGHLRRLAPSAPIADAVAAIPLRLPVNAGVRYGVGAGLLFHSSLHRSGSQGVCAAHTGVLPAVLEPVTAALRRAGSGLRQPLLRVASKEGLNDSPSSRIAANPLVQLQRVCLPIVHDRRGANSGDWQTSERQVDELILCGHLHGAQGSSANQQLPSLV